MKTINDQTTANQLELTLPSSRPTCSRRPLNARRTTRATWWFTQMRRAVDCATASHDQPAPLRSELQAAIV